MNILIIEDNPLIVDSFKTLVSFINPTINILEATSLREGMRIFERERNNLRHVFVDGNLPDGYGISLIKEIKGRFSGKIISIPGDNTNEERDLCLETGADIFCPKNEFEVDRLSAILNS